MKWQPIETAPRDGQILLVTDGKLFAAAKPFDYTEPEQLGYDGRPLFPDTRRQNPNAGTVHKLWSAIGCSAFDPDTATDDYDGSLGILSPTHWMPLPPPPSE